MFGMNEKGPLYKFDLGLLSVQKRPKTSKILISNATSSAPQCCGTEFLYKSILHGWRHGLNFLTFHKSSPNRLVFVPIAISHP